MKQIKIGSIIIFCLMVASIGAMFVGCSSGSEGNNGEIDNETIEAEESEDTNREEGNKKKTIESGEKVTIEDLSIRLTSPVEATVNPEGVVVSYEADIVGELLEKSTITLRGKEVTLDSEEVSFYKDLSLKKGIFATGNEVEIGEVCTYPH